MSRKPARSSKKKPAPPSAWARLSKGTKALVALVGTTAVAAAVPGVLPYASDRVLDLFHAPIVEIRSEFGPSLAGLTEAAAEAVTTEPAQVLTDPRFVPAGFSLAKLTLEGKRSAPVVVLGATVQIIDRLPPRQGTLYFIRSQGEGDDALVDLNLDAPAPYVASPGDGRPYFAAKHVTVGHGELVVIAVQSRTTKHEYSWRIRLQLRYRGGDSEMTIPPAGEPPFRMTAFVAADAYRRQFVWNNDGIVVPRDCATDKAACAAIDLPK
jgi:hypothetical protein